MYGLVGCSGFIGSNVARLFKDIRCLTRLDLCYPVNESFKKLFIAAPSAEKWRIDADPNSDLKNILSLVEQISANITTDEVILFSTIDVYSNIGFSTEFSETLNDCSYGGNRRFLEEALAAHFSNIKILRLGGLFGEGLKKNLIYDIRNNRGEQVSRVNGASQFQFLSIDQAITFGLNTSANLSNIVGPPISVCELPRVDRFSFSSNSNIVHYDVRTTYSNTGYLSNKKKVLSEIQSFIEMSGN